MVNASGDRGVIYLAAARTGLRNDELRQLVWGDINVSTDAPTIRIRATTTKNKKTEHLPILEDVRQALHAIGPASAGVNDPVFENGVPRAIRLKRDLERAGIPYQNEEGRFADFHSLRHTYATFLLGNGVNPRAAMQLMRHSDIGLTTKLYLDDSQLPTRSALATLPRLTNGKGSRIGSRKIGSGGLSSSGAVAECRELESREAPDYKGLGRDLSRDVAEGPEKKMERAKRLSPLPTPKTAVSAASGMGRGCPEDG